MNAFKKFSLISAAAVAMLALNACGDSSGAGHSVYCMSENSFSYWGVEFHSKHCLEGMSDDEEFTCGDGKENTSSSHEWLDSCPDDYYWKCTVGHNIMYVYDNETTTRICDDEAVKNEKSGNDQESSSSEEIASSSSIEPDPDPDQETEDFGSSSSDTPDDVEESSSSETPIEEFIEPEEPDELIKPVGYYKTNCPVSFFNCKDAASTEYLNQELLDAGKYGEFLDTRDGKVYKTIKICDKEHKNCQTWMAQNLNYDPGDVSSFGERAWSGCYGDGGFDYYTQNRLTAEEAAENCSKFGRLYSWEVAMDKAACSYGNACYNRYESAQGVCPDGWHLPSNTEWETLYKAASAQGLKANSTLWKSYGSVKNDNSFGFTALPAGFRDLKGNYGNMAEIARFWSSTENMGSPRVFGFYWQLSYDESRVLHYNGEKYYGNSVRCIRGEEPEIPEEDVNPAEVMPSGYYKTNCPADNRCKDATTTEYLNQDMLTAGKYGEILDTRDGQVYKTIEICSSKNNDCQTWMAQNLNYNPGDVASLGENAWSGCHEDNAEKCDIYGRLYTWEVAMNNADCALGKECKPYKIIRGICPTGWHVPGREEWSKLFSYVATNVNIAGQKLKSNTDLWLPYANFTNDDTHGFSAIPAGIRLSDESFSEGSRYAYFWTSSEESSDKARTEFLSYNNNGINSASPSKSFASPVRCVKNYD
ncbi:MAG: hypothetical protein MJY98_12955 [Fibrobacter sp.]|nr:hypothetical protein [Fibrobacter sp.]